MSNVRHTTFSGMTAEEFRTYAEDLLEAYTSAAERQRLQAYLHQILLVDKSAADADTIAAGNKRLLQRDQREILELIVQEHAHDFSRALDLFTEQSKTDAEILALATVDNAEIFLRDRELTGNLVASGDNVKISGLGATGSAATDALTHSVIINGRIDVSGTDVTIEGIHFKFPCEFTAGGDEFPMIRFSGSTNVRLVLKDCTFEMTGTHADGRFLHGSGSGGGTQLIENCVIKNFTSWMLGDATTASGTALVKLDHFKLEQCRIDNCMGSFAVRGMAADPNTLVEFKNNTVAFGSLGQHNLFWSCFESNNQLRVICEDNTVTGAANGGAASDRQFFQAWSRSARPWTMRYQRNAVSGFYVAVACACVATFYSPDYYSSDYLVTATAAELTSVEYGASFVFDGTNSWKSTLSYAPENITVYPTVPPTSLAAFSVRP